MATLNNMKTFALMAMLAFAGAAGLPQKAVAEIQAVKVINTSLDKLSTKDTEKAADKNVKILESRAEALRAKISAKQAKLSSASPNSGQYMRLQAEIAQMTATADALEQISAKVEAGFVITDYKVTSDESSLGSSIVIKLEDKDGTTAKITAEIPSVESPVDTADSSTGYGSSTGTGGYGSTNGSTTGTTSQMPGTTPTTTADPLTQALQQIAQMFGLGGATMPGAQTPGAMPTATNPFAGVMPALDAAVNPVAPVTMPVSPIASTFLQCAPGGLKPADGTAVYDITAGKVYMPDGTVLEAHSGLAKDGMMDKPQFVNQKAKGPTPPGVYTLSMREKPYYGVEAIRMTPVAGTQMYGRDGILAHSPLRVSSGGGSAGCIAFNDYAKFLAAFKAGQVTQVAVVPSMSAEQMAKMCSGAKVDTPNPTSTVK